MKKHILIIDDEEAITDLLSETLEGNGYRVTAVSNGIAATKVARVDPPQLVVCDLQLEDSDGLLTIAELKRIVPGVPTMLLTGILFDPKIVSEVLESHVSAYLPKPSTLATIVSEVKRLLGDS